MPVFALKQFQQKSKRKIFFCIVIFDDQLSKGKATFFVRAQLYCMAEIICHTIYFRNFVVGDHGILHVKRHKPTTSLLITKFTISYNSSNSRDIKVGVLIIISLITR